MNRYHSPGAFIQYISAEALGSAAVNHPYLCALREGNLPNVDLAFKDFAFQYGFYSTAFIRYVSAVIQNLSNAEHKQILLCNLAEEQGNNHDLDLPPDVLASVIGQPHASLYRRLQEALGIDANYLKTTQPSQTSLSWSRQFLQICQVNACAGIGAIGIGTELIVSRIYDQILEGLDAHSHLTMTQRVFFDLHSKCDDQHAAKLLLIAEELAQSPTACEQIEYGTRKAIDMRVAFWDKMLERAHGFPVSTSPSSEKLSAFEY
jgi:pyrroloquinoline quinone (PQQ) biosynthesis protein C